MSAPGRGIGEYDLPLVTFQEAVPGALDGKEMYLLKYSANGANGVALSAASGDEIGTMYEKLQTGGAPDVTVKTLSDGLVRKVIASGVTNDGDWLVGDGTGKVVSLAAGYIPAETTLVTTGHYRTALGKALVPNGPSAAGDVIGLLCLRTCLVFKAS